MEPEFHVVNAAGADYQCARETLTPGLREALLRAASRAGLQEDDPIYGLLVAQAEMLNTVNAARVAGAKKLTAILASQQALLEKVAATVSENATRASEHSSSTHQEFEQLRGWIAQKQANVESTLQKEAEQFRHEFQNKAANYLDELREQHAAGQVRRIKIALVIAYAIGVVSYPILDVIIAWVRQFVGM